MVAFKLIAALELAGTLDLMTTLELPVAFGSSKAVARPKVTGSFKAAMSSVASELIATLDLAGASELAAVL